MVISPAPEPTHKMLSPSSAIVEAFARTVAKPGSIAMLIDADNKENGWMPIDQAVLREEAFAVAVADGILAVDCDDPDRATAIGHLADWLEQRNIRAVVVASGRQGHRHLFARILEKGLFEAAGRKSASLGLGRGRHSIRPPLSPHRLRLPVRLLRPEDPYEALHSLIATGTRRTLSERISALLREGDLIGRYPSRSEVVQAIVQEAVNAGWSLREVVATLSDPANKGGERVQEEIAKGGYVRRSWEIAILRAAMFPPKPTRQEIHGVLSDLRREANETPWRGTSGATDRIMFEALLHVASRAGTLRFTASYRQVAEEAGVWLGTAHQSLRRLEKEGWIRTAGRRNGTSSWDLREVSRTKNNRSHTPNALRPNVPELHQLSHDAFRHRGLGKNGLRIWRTLEANEGARVAQLAKRLGIHRSTVARKLSLLKAFGLARRLTSGAWVSLEGSLDQVAEEIGTAGAGQRQRERHKADREEVRKDRERRFLIIPGGLVDPETGLITPKHRRGPDRGGPFRAPQDGRVSPQ